MKKRPTVPALIRGTTSGGGSATSQRSSGFVGSAKPTNWSAPATLRSPPSGAQRPALVPRHPPPAP
jgi:hypothetical protein